MIFVIEAWSNLGALADTNRRLGALEFGARGSGRLRGVQLRPQIRQISRRTEPRHGRADERAGVAGAHARLGHDPNEGGEARPVVVGVHDRPPQLQRRRVVGKDRCRDLGADPVEELLPLPGGAARVTDFLVAATHSETVRDEIVGLSEGVAGQEFTLAHCPVLLGDSLVLEVAGGSDWEQWREVDSFAGSDADDRVFTVDHGAGLLRFGPAVRQPDGTVRQYGGVPPKGAPIRAPRYRLGGGEAGNVTGGALSTLRTSVPLINKVENRAAASAAWTPRQWTRPGCAVHSNCAPGTGPSPPRTSRCSPAAPNPASRG